MRMLSPQKDEPKKRKTESVVETYLVGRSGRQLQGAELCHA